MSTQNGLLPFSLPDLGDKEIEAVIHTLKSGWLSIGPKTKQFEEAFRTRIGAEFAIAVNSCTSGLFLSLVAMGVGVGDEVLTTPFTFAATAAVILHTGATPVFVDIDEKSLNINVDELETKITERTKVIIPVHFAGYPCDMDRINSLAKERGLRVLDDAAHAFPASFKGKMIGTLADATAFSFYATKNLTTGEGGMVTTNDPELAQKIRLLSLHGLSRDAWKRYSAGGSWYYEVLFPGYKCHMNDISASLGLVQLNRIDEMMSRRMSIVNLYFEMLRGLDYLILPEEANERYGHAWHLFTIRLRPGRLRISRDEFVDEMNRAGVGCSVHFIPLHMHPFYRDRFGFRPESFPVAERVFRSIVSLPLYSKMSLDDARHVATTVREIGDRYRIR